MKAIPLYQAGSTNVPSTTTASTCAGYLSSSSTTRFAQASGYGLSGGGSLQENSGEGRTGVTGRRRRGRLSIHFSLRSPRPLPMKHPCGGDPSEVFAPSHTLFLRSTRVRTLQLPSPHSSFAIAAGGDLQGWNAATEQTAYACLALPCE